MSASAQLEPGLVRPARRPPGWQAPGPAPLGPQGRADLHPGPGEDLCFLSGDWRIFQKRRGHRWSADDLVTAWVAAQDATTGPCLDLGCGIGTVLMLVAWRAPGRRVTGIEAQPHSAALARRSLAYNGAADRCTVVDGDLRDPAALPPGARFGLITGTPPYFPRGRGLESAQIQKAPCRFEHRGGVEAYLDAAARWLAPGGRFVMCMAPSQAARSEHHARAVALAVTARLEVRGAPGKPPRFCVYSFAPMAIERHAATSTLTIRDEAGQWTPAYARLRTDMGLPPAP